MIGHKWIVCTIRLSVARQPKMVDPKIQRRKARATTFILTKKESLTWLGLASLLERIYSSQKVKVFEILDILRVDAFYIVVLGRDSYCTVKYLTFR